MRPIEQILCEHTFNNTSKYKCIKCGYVLPFMVQDYLNKKEFTGEDKI